MQSPGKIIAVSLALSGFITAIVAGLAVGNGAHDTILRAIAAMFACLFVGAGLGVAGTRAVAEMLETFRAEHRVPEISDHAHDARAQGGGRA